MLMNHYCKVALVAEFGDKIAQFVHKLHKYIKDHEEKVVIDGIAWAPAPSQNVLIGEKHVINDSLSRCAILRKEAGDRVFYALSRRSAIHYPLFKSESCIENDY